MYTIKRVSDDMWLMGYMHAGCGAPTCIWGDNIQGAKLFQDQIDAKLLAKKIGGCIVIYRPTKGVIGS